MKGRFSLHGNDKDSPMSIYLKTIAIFPALFLAVAPASRMWYPKVVVHFRAFRG
jgi:hypothetical protein